MARQFELRFDEDQEIGAGAGGGCGGGQDFGYGDEGDVDCDKVDGLEDFRGAEVARVAGNANYSGILAELPG